MENFSKNKVKLAVFDFDGTIIPAQSGQKIAQYLIKTGTYNRRTIAKLIFWGLRYKTHLPYKEKTARELIFRAFENKNAKDVDKFIDEFYEKNLEATVRKPLIEIANALKDKGCEVVVLSGAFTSTLASFAKRHDFLHIVGTVMEVDETGKYTGKVQGECVAGDQKIKQLLDYADNTFGKENWEIEYAFADHYTDCELLKLAKYVYAVQPDKTLEHYAKKNKWFVINFTKDSSDKQIPFKGALKRSDNYA